MMGKIYRLVIWLFLAASLVINFGIGTAYAESVDAVMARLEQAKAEGGVDAETYNDLKGLLNSVKAARSAVDYEAATQAYNLLAPSNLSASFDPYQ